MFKIIALGLLGLCVAGAVWVRFAPTDPANWHQTFSSRAPGEYDKRDAYFVVRKVSDPATTLASLDAIIMATPRTTRIAGSVDDAMITYVTRTKRMGFPDYTTIFAGADDTVEGGFGPLLKIHGRLRFGKADLGVNKARIIGWLAAFDAQETSNS